MNAKYSFVATMGALMGLAGIEHGIGEILQGNGTAAGMMIRSWPDAAFFQSLNGEPAMTILPNLLITGILAVLFSALFTGWAIFFARRKQGGLVLILLALLMLLFGGGIFPPILGALIGAAATSIQLTAAKPVTGLARLLGQAWGWIFAACCLAWLALFPGVAMLDFFFGVDDVRLTLTMIALAFGLLFLAYGSSIQHDRMQYTRSASTLRRHELHSA
jgi:hypothetical protein